MTDLARNLGVFLRVYLPRDRRASRHTIESYKVSLKLLVLFAAERLSVRPCVIEVEQLTTQLILDFLDSLERERENTVATRNVRLAAIKALFRFLEYRSACHVDLSGQVHAIPKKRSDQKLIDWLERHELQALLDAPDIRTAAGVRDRAMLHLAYAAALRVSELTALRLDSLGQPDIDTVRVMGKGRRERILPLWRETRSTLVDWLNIRPSVEDNHLFLNARGVVMGRHGFARRLSCHAAVAAKKVPSIARKCITPHCLRHSCAVHTLEATRDIRKVSLWLGHATLQSTEIYLRVSPVQKLELLAANVPPGLKKGVFTGARDSLLALLDSV